MRMLEWCILYVISFASPWEVLFSCILVAIHLGAVRASVGLIQLVHIPLPSWPFGGCKSGEADWNVHFSPMPVLTEPIKVWHGIQAAYAAIVFPSVSSLCISRVFTFPIWRCSRLFSQICLKFVRYPVGTGVHDTLDSVAVVFLVVPMPLLREWKESERGKQDFYESFTSWFQVVLVSCQVVSASFADPTRVERDYRVVSRLICVLVEVLQF